MIMSTIRILFSALWILLAAIFWAISYSVTYNDDFSISISGVDQTSTLGIVYFVVGIVLGITAIGVYLQNKLSLLVIIPVLAFSIVWFVDVVTADHIWFKYVASSVVLSVVSIGSVFSVWRST